MIGSSMVARHVALLERRVGRHDAELNIILAVLHKLLGSAPSPLPPRRHMGFVMNKVKR